MFKLRRVDDLAEELGSLTKAMAALREAGVLPMFGMYDVGALDALQAEPKQSNIGKNAKNTWTLSPTDGIGAIKAVLDPLDVDIVRHLYRRTHYITIRNGAGKRQQVKLYCVNSKHPKSGNASFSMTGFLRETSAAYYMMMCFEGPTAWALSRGQATAMHKAALKNGGEGVGVRIGPEAMEDLNGRMRVTFAPDSQYLLTEAKQLGL